VNHIFTKIRKSKIKIRPHNLSSKIPSELSEVDILTTKDNPGFRRAGLKADSVIKLDKIATVLKDLIVGELGDLDEELKKEVNQKLKKTMEI
jgi:mRNA interferase MazF